MTFETASRSNCLCPCSARACSHVSIQGKQARVLQTIIKPMLDWYGDKLEAWGYPAIALLMAVESSLLPLPSELVIPPAADFVHHNPGKLTYTGIVLAGTVGSWVGASVMYWLSRLLGRPFVLRYGRYFFISPDKVAGAERWAAKFGSMGIFISRLLPVVRHLIGIPAGIVRMDFLLYSLYTVLGSGIWCAILCWIGVKMGNHVRHGDARGFGLFAAGIIAVLGALYYFFVHRHMKNVDGKAGEK